jgi:hypothetical protein
MPQKEKAETGTIWTALSVYRFANVYYLLLLLLFPFSLSSLECAV